ncbi:TMEM175 family protein [Streptomyces sp. HUAS TT20]|uniref:TMEM175 family protein n=1 Tax=Streptomyces sp. HUAS TT20 TaxID=3447509 RepID=UPI0021D93374|nr:TMEM175 family protein [Streptomyces sp. HUAS 15-9]UXY33147.1 TMEM175 family protein [Streptomyces sp. HUAS 15-9]
MSETGRVEAFSDGVFAIAITLLVLEIHVPSEHGHKLTEALTHQWPSYVAYVVSFLVIGVMWVNHHALFGHLAKVDRTLVFLNLLLLMVVAVLPWPTALLAEHLRDTDDARVAGVIYSGVMVMHAVCYGAIWWYVTHRGHLLHPEVDREAARATRIRFSLGSVAYPATVGLALVSPTAMLAVHGLMAVYYAFNHLAVLGRERLPTSAKPE